MPKNNQPTYIITPDKFTYGGEVMGRLPDGRAVFVPFALPGETVQVRLVEEKPRYARAELVEVLTPSTERIAPICKHFAECGGCHYQHMQYEDQLAAKTAILGDQLERIGGLADPPVQSAVPSPNPTLYRNHVQFHLTGDGHLGYHKSRSEEVLPIQECYLPQDAINVVWPQLDFEANPDLDRIGLRLGAADDMQLILKSTDMQPPAISVEDLSLSVVHLSPVGSIVLVGSEYTIIEVLERPFQVSAGSFFQVNSGMTGIMVEHIMDWLAECYPLTNEINLVDAYCGVGLFSAFLAPRVGHLTAIESNSAAAEDFVVNLDEFDNVELYEAPVEIVLPDLKVRPDVLVVDPPRSGLDRLTMDGILEQGPSVLIYVSCDPATLARDARRLIKGGYRLEQVTPFDQFPQTFHIESIGYWMRENDAG